MRRLAATGALCLALSVGVGTGSAFGASASNARYALANGCYSLVSKTAGKPVAKSPSGGYRVADAGAEGFRMQAARARRVPLLRAGAGLHGGAAR